MGLGSADSRRLADLSIKFGRLSRSSLLKPVQSPAATTPNAADLEAARRQDAGAFERLVGPHRKELLAHCYRMLGSAADAEDALQETLLRAWRGLPSFEGRSSLRSWLYRIATNVCLKMIERRPKRVLPIDYGPANDPHDPPEGPLVEQVWLEPYPDEALGVEDGPASPEARYEERESVELAFVAALQHLPGRQRAVLLLRDVLGFAPAEIAAALDATPAAVYSALQRARQAVDERLPERSQQATLRSIGDERLREAVERFMDAWERNDVAAIAAMLTDDATFTMPPEPSWYVGRSAVAGFFASRPLSGRLQWRHVPVRANGQPAVGLYAATAEDSSYLPDAIMVLGLDSSAQITSVTAFREPAAFARFGLPDQIAR
jgi:RNA polymerase sigma-70 factor (ECF subfamily)